ncbi:carboxylating nicotinate-nucleotide diphosphorylase [Oleiagrimonas sp. C23AA]|uniref:carboxylating nicotinate-nucleotide diphosphorylase n=1 Tax=Oleiagrimonas sp. C23AA TaxID=2719047 RepID=UPI00142203A6|nr:carboxylating nicotinate-nucleotide diphosphorylase [Oleiagrimonas sp. C23AA]NII11474.1 carboxylating nicotinate-nucleotide diphosphorylase [Oleiagrimonas sp. C23AA]
MHHRFDPVADSPSADDVRRDVERALAEDLGSGDLTAQLLPAGRPATAHVLCRDQAVIAGRPWFDACYLILDAGIVIEWLVEEGQQVAPDTILCRLQGPARALVSAERTSLNFLQTLSGTATETARYAAALEGTDTRVLDTRKTLPGLRMAQKYAVRAGGGHNHRIGLFDAILIKENHIAAAGGIAPAVAAARALHANVMVEVEVESMDELAQAIEAGADRIMLDEFDTDALIEAVRFTAGHVPLEVSGSVDLARMKTLARIGVDFISVGALTKHVHAVDLSMRLSIDT